jgi:hypothetical protein
MRHGVLEAPWRMVGNAWAGDISLAVSPSMLSGSSVLSLSCTTLSASFTKTSVIRERKQTGKCQVPSGQATHLHVAQPETEHPRLTPESGRARAPSATWHTKALNTLALLALRDFGSSRKSQSTHSYIFTMAGSSMCPCSSCFGSAPQHAPAQQQQPQQPPSAHSEYPGGKKNRSMFGKLRRSRSIESMASTLIGLATDAQPMAGSDDKEGAGY